MLNQGYFPLSIPLFDGGARNARIQKAKYDLLKTKNTMERLDQAIQLDISSSKLKLESALKTLENQKKNVTLAEGVYNSTKFKYEQGLGSNMEIYNSQTELKLSPNNSIEDWDEYPVIIE